jgi:nicotinate-nucleotide adenylyltransferase
VNIKPIGILGGTFDPIHLGHLHLAQQVLRNCQLAKIIFIPAHQSPLRKPPVATDQHRLQMLKLALADSPNFVIDESEIAQQKISYAITTLRSLRNKWPTTPLCLIMGVDAFCRFDEWYEWQEILQLTHIIVANRPGSQLTLSQPLQQVLQAHQIASLDALQATLFGKIFFTDIQPLAISATQIRSLIQQHQDASRLLPQAVWAYILQNNIYVPSPALAKSTSLS